MGQVIAREQCPICLDTGSDNVARYADGSAYCFSCGWADLADTIAKHDKVTIPSTVANSPTGWKKRGITKEAMDRCNVHRLAAEQTIVKEDGTHEYPATQTLVFPYYDFENGELVGYKKRDVSTTKKEGIRWVGDSSRASLFGIGAHPKNASICVLVEGEPDVLAVYSVVQDVAVFGIPGAESTEKVLKKAYKFISNYKKIVLLLDNDEPGRRAQDKAIAVLPKAKVHIAEVPSNYKDVGDMVQAGLTKDVATLIREAKQLVPPAIVSDEDLLSAYYQAYEGVGNAQGIPYGFASLDAASGGLHGGELVTIVAGTGAGKSTFVEKLALNIASAGEVVFFCPLEMQPKAVLQKMMQHKTGLPIARPDFKRNGDTDDRTKGVAEGIVERVKFLNHFGGMNVEQFLLNCEAAIAQHGAKVIIVDHLTALVTASMGGGNNVFASDNITSRLKDFALEHDVTVICISHVSRNSSYDVENKVPQLRHLRGGNGIAQYSDFVIGLGRKRSEKTTDVETIKLHRMVGEHKLFKLEYKNYTLVELEGEDFDDAEDECEESVHEASNIRQQVRVQSKPDVPRAEVPPTRDTTVRNTPQVLPGLHDGERNGNRMQGLFQPGGQSEDVSFKGAAPINRVHPGVLETGGDDIDSESDNLRGVGSEERLQVLHTV